MSRETASQTAGPYVQIGLMPNSAGLPMDSGDLGHVTFGRTTGGTRIAFTGRILDGAGDPVTDAMIEVWQADTDGRTPPPAGTGFPGWARTHCDDDGRFAFDTVMPGALPGQAPHLTLWIVARGIGLPLQTRAYFDGAPENATDPVLSRVPAARRDTMTAQRDGPEWHMNIVLQGPDETVFLDI